MSYFHTHIHQSLFVNRTWYSVLVNVCIIKASCPPTCLPNLTAALHFTRNSLVLHKSFTSPSIPKLTHVLTQDNKRCREKRLETRQTERQQNASTGQHDWRAQPRSKTGEHNRWVLQTTWQRITEGEGLLWSGGWLPKWGQLGIIRVNESGSGRTRSRSKPGRDQIRVYEQEKQEETKKTETQNRN